MHCARNTVGTVEWLSLRLTLKMSAPSTRGHYILERDGTGHTRSRLPETGGGPVGEPLNHILRPTKTSCNRFVGLLSTSIDTVEALLKSSRADMNWSFGLMPYGPEWRRYRRTFHDFFRRADLGQLHPIMYEERDKFLHSLEENPADFFENLAL